MNKEKFTNDIKNTLELYKNNINKVRKWINNKDKLTSQVRINCYDTIDYKIEPISKRVNKNIDDILINLSMLIRGKYYENEYHEKIKVKNLIIENNDIIRIQLINHYTEKYEGILKLEVV